VTGSSGFSHTVSKQILPQQQFGNNSFSVTVQTTVKQVFYTNGCKSKTADVTSCVINDKMPSTDSSSKFSELIISMTGNSSGYISVYVN